MTNAVLRALQVDARKSVNAARNVLYQANFLQGIVQKLDTDPESVIKDLNTFREACKWRTQNHYRDGWKLISAF